MISVLSLRRLLSVGLLILIATPANAQETGEETTVSRLIAEKSVWNDYAKARRTFQLNARFESRATQSFRCEQLDLIFRHPASLRLPDRVLRGQRIDILGYFQTDSGRTFFRVVRMQTSETDDELLRRRVRAVADDPEMMLTIAAEYSAEATFYEDDDLRAEISGVRTAAIRLLKESARGDSAALRLLLNRGAGLGISSELTTQLQFEWINSSLQDQSADLKLLQFACRQLNGWDTSTRLSPVIRRQFAESPEETWESAAPGVRRQLHRTLYTTVRSKQLQAELDETGSNGFEIAVTARKEIPENTSLIRALEDAQVNWFRSNAAKRTRQELVALCAMLNRAKRDDEAMDIRKQWLQTQEGQFGIQSLAGQVRTADEYLFVADQWQDTNAAERGVLLLKAAWETAAKESPGDAAGIATRLKQLGWERFRDRWMNEQQMRAIPRSDVQLAAREGRVVAGMTQDQVTLILGLPTSISRVGSSRSIREFWSYPEAGLVILLKRNLQTAGQMPTVSGVSRIKP